MGLSVLIQFTSLLFRKISVDISIWQIAIDIFIWKIYYPQNTLDGKYGSIKITHTHTHSWPQETLILWVWEEEIHITNIYKAKYCKCHKKGEKIETQVLKKAIISSWSNQEKLPGRRDFWDGCFRGWVAVLQAENISGLSRRGTA